MFQAAYYVNPENHTNRAWTAAGERNGPGIVQQYFLSSAVIPAVLIGGMYNPVGGHNWANHWLWRRNIILERKKIHRSIRKFYPREETTWESEIEDSDADDNMDVDVEAAASGEDEVAPAQPNAARGAKRRGRPGGSKNKKGKKRSTVPGAVAQSSTPSLSREAPPSDTAEEDNGRILATISETQMTSSHNREGAAMDITGPNQEEWVTVTTENAQLIMDI